MRINKYIAHSGISSRRKADDLIAEGRVRVNGVIIQEKGIEVTEQDVVEVDGNIVSKEKRLVYLMMNKPAGYLCSSSDDRGRKTVLDLVKKTYPERLYSVGRLDFDTEGLLILTNDGDAANALIHPRSEINKVYYVELDAPLTVKAIRNIEAGVLLDDYKTKPAKIKRLGNGTSINRCLITISEGKNRQVRKMFATQRMNVRYLKRLAIGELFLEDLEVGKFRSLTKKEIHYIKSISK